QRRCLPHGTVRRVHVVMVGVLGQHASALPTSKAQHPIQQLTPNRAHPARRGGVRPRPPHRRAQHLDPLSREDRLERGGELGITIAQHQPKPTDPLRGIDHHVSGLLCHPLPHRLRRPPPAHWTRRVATSIATSTYTRLRKTVSTAKKSTASTPEA